MLPERKITQSQLVTDVKALGVKLDRIGPRRDAGVFKWHWSFGTESGDSLFDSEFDAALDASREMQLFHPSTLVVADGPLANAIAERRRILDEFNSIPARVRADIREACIAFLGRVPGSDEKVFDLIAEADARAGGKVAK